MKRRAMPRSAWTEFVWRGEQPPTPTLDDNPAWVVDVHGEPWRRPVGFVHGRNVTATTKRRRSREVK